MGQSNAGCCFVFTVCGAGNFSARFHHVAHLVSNIGGCKVCYKIITSCCFTICRFALVHQSVAGIECYGSHHFCFTIQTYKVRLLRKSVSPSVSKISGNARVSFSKAPKGSIQTSMMQNTPEILENMPNKLKGYL